MPTKFNLTRDINGVNGFGLVFTDTAYSCTLTANTDTTLTIPDYASIGGATYYGGSTEPKLIAIFSYDPGSSVWVADGETAAVPAGSSFAATTSELNPAARQVNGGDVLHFISLGTAINVSVALYWINA